MRRLALLFLTLAAVVSLNSSAIAKVQAVSTDGEATVYLVRNFAQDFDLWYDVRFPTSQGNRSWSFVSLLLMGRGTQSGSVSVGLSRAAGKPVVGFTDVTRPHATPAYRNVAVRCRAECTIELRGSRNAIVAFIDHRRAGTWLRKALALSKPYVQINGEVSAVGDRISARVVPIRTQIAGQPLPPPSCAFTTQGVRASRVNGELRFAGRRDPHEGATYVSLATGATGDTCHAATGL
jgi:hypothetical protein